MGEEARPTIDSHLHIWDLSTGSHDWLTPDHGPIFRTFTPDDVTPELDRCGVDQVILVQAANSLADTRFMLGLARRWDRVAGVVGWLPLDRPGETEEVLLDEADHRLCGVRHLMNREADPDWLRRGAVLEGLEVLSSHGIPLDVVVALPRHLEHIPYLSERVPDLRIVIDHLGRPPIAKGRLEPWRTLMAEAAQSSHVSVKVSALVPRGGASVGAAQPYVDAVVELFGCNRLLFGSDWPVVLLTGTYRSAFELVRDTTRHLDETARSRLMGGTAAEVYRLGTTRPSAT